MKRKLVKQGTTTLMISLPSKWLKNNALNKGDEIEISDDQNGLIITKGAAKQQKKKGSQRA